jgi:hypothetical protein
VSRRRHQPWRRLAVLVVTVFFAGAPNLRADWLFVPFVGSTFGRATTLPDGSSVLPDEDPPGHRRLVFGGSAGWLSQGILGVQADVAFVPGFFDNELVSASRVVNVGVDTLFAVPAAVTRDSLRPYLVVGSGWMHARVEETQDVLPELFGSRNFWGISVGVGAIGYMTEQTGLRFEVRQVRSLDRDEDPFTGERGSVVRFWRITVGVVIRN